MCDDLPNDWTNLRLCNMEDGHGLHEVNVMGPKVWMGLMSMG